MIKDFKNFITLPHWRNKNIAIIYYTYFATSAWFTLVMWYIFFLKVASPEQIALIHTLGFVVGIVFDVPSGYLADKFGRKKLLIIGLLLFSLGMGLFAFITNVWQMYLFEIITQLGVACISGAQEAVLHNTVSAIEKTKNKVDELFTLVYSKCRMIANFALLISGLAGGFIYYLNDKSNWLGMAILCLIAAILCFGLVDYHDRMSMGDAKAVAHIKDGMKILVNRRNFGLLLVILSLGGIAFISDWGIFSYGSLESAGYKPIGLGIFFTFVYAATLFANSKLPQLKKRLGNTEGFALYAKITVVLLLIGAACHMYKPVLVVVPLGLFIVVSTVFISYLTAVVSAITTEKHRATALSASSFLSKFLYMFCAPLMGISFSIGRPQYNYIGFAVLAIITLIVTRIYLPKNLSVVS
jgi:MFS family permease